jgi:uncharacterized integral membrane protein (TIGR00697 family)
MNELLFVSTMLIALTLVLAALRMGIVWITGLIAVYLLIANLFASKLSVIFGLTSSLAIPMYAAIFLATDSISEHFGPRAAVRAVWFGFCSQACLVIFGQLMAHGSSFGDPAVSDALDILFGFVPRIVLGSFIAYIVSQHVDVIIFHYFKRKFNDKHIWLRNCISTPISQGIDTVLFLSIAFAGVLPNVVEFMFFVWIVKLGIALADTPFMYLTYPVLGKPLPHRVVQAKE